MGHLEIDVRDSLCSLLPNMNMQATAFSQIDFGATIHQSQWP